MKNIVKFLTALAAVAGAVYIIATYGDEIVAWAKKIWSAMPKCPCCEETEAAEAAVEVSVPVEQAGEEPVAAEEVSVEEAVEEPAPEVTVAENEPTAAEEDFAE